MFKISFKNEELLLLGAKTPRPLAKYVKSWPHHPDMIACYSSSIDLISY
jgi:hypothetical protein